MVSRLTILSWLLLVPLCANAADLPKQGTDSYTTAYITVTANTMKAGDRTVVVYDSYGISRNDDGRPMFNAMGVRCEGTRETVGNESTNRGTCVDIDKDGDEIFSTYEAKGGAGAHTFFGGTGKYAGLTGTADYTYEPVKSPDGHGMGIVRHKSNWKLP